MLLLLYVSCSTSPTLPKENANFEERGLSCQKDLVLESGYCCWKGQGWNGHSCVGEAICPAGQIALGNQCKIFRETVDYEVVLIPKGTFQQGCSARDQDCSGLEQPAHNVTLDKDFYMMESEVTQELYTSVMNTNPSTFIETKHPVEMVTWYNAIQFANQLSHLEGKEQCYILSENDVQWKEKDCTGWRLPTEAEWERAARGDEAYLYAGSNHPNEVGWSGEHWEGGHYPVCLKKRNRYGLCDMSGNVMEWVWDWKADYTSQNKLNPSGPLQGSSRIVRGGSWNLDNRFLRVSERYEFNPDHRDAILGFRLVYFP